MADTKVSDGEQVVSADELKTGRLYVLEESDKGEHLRHLPKQPDELPKIRIMESTLVSLRQFCSKARGDMNGYKPDMTMAASALLEYAVELPEATSVLRRYFVTMMSGIEEEKVKVEESR